jgi:hypothetical protein
MNRFIFRLVLVFGLTSVAFCDSPPPATIQFTNYPVLNSPFSAGVTADLDGDGKFDVIERNAMRMFWNSGSNLVGGATYNYTRDGNYPMPPVFGDFDNDSDVDVFHVRMENTSRRSTTLLWNSGKRLFTNQPPISFPALMFGAGAAGDFDNDGDLDIVATGSTNTSVSQFGRNVMRLYENFGNGLFLEAPQRFRGYEDGATSWADYDADGDLDLLVTGYTTNDLRAASVLYRNDAGQLVDSQVALPSLVAFTYAPVSAVWGDYDGDEDLDLLMAGATLFSNGRRAFAAIMRNDGTAFTQVPFITNSAATAFSATWCDFDADGHLDIIVNTVYGGPTSAFRNKGDGTFANPVSVGVAGDPRVAFWNDDFQPDLFSVNFDFPIRPVRNITAATNTPPEPPTGLLAIQTNNAVTFAWNAALDAQQSSGLTYNLRIGTTPGGSEIMSAMANPTNGRPYVATLLGNTGLRTNWTIRNFSIGSYYWSVQAIDRSCVRSIFAAEQTFTITNAAPALEMVATTNLTSSSATLLLRLNPNGALTDYYVEFLVGAGPSLVKQIEGDRRTDLHLLLAGLEPSTQYQVRIVASNEFGISYSSPRSFTTAPAAVVTELLSSFPVLTQNPTFLPVDLDQDGDLDVVQAGASNLTWLAKVFLNDVGIFKEGAPLSTPSSGGIGIAAAADFNNDALLDLIFAPGGFLFTQKTNGTFAFRLMNERVRLPQTFPGDADNDGDIDLIAPGSGPLGTVANILNDNTDTFRLALSRFDRAQIAEWGDYDNDGDNDLLLWGLTNEVQLNPAAAITRVFRNDGGNVFTNIQAQLPGAWLGAKWADYDNDRDLDVILLSTNSSSVLTNDLRFFRNDGTNGFAETTTPILSDYSLLLLDPIDFNRDGRPDLFMYQDLPGADKLRLWLNSGEDQFEEQSLGLPLLTNFTARFADFDGDQMPDVLVQAQATNSSQGRLRLFRNNLLSTNPLPPRPTNLSSTVGRTSATLRWETPAGTEETNVVAWNFNLRVGKTPGGSEIMNAMADRHTGALQTLARANAGQNGSWTVRDLPPGKYYWAVQSVDHARNASVFSDEMTFEIAPEERPLRILSAAHSPQGAHLLMVDGPTRSRARVLHSVDLVNWETGFNYVYIGSEPSLFAPGYFGSHFYRFLLE